MLDVLQGVSQLSSGQQVSTAAAAPGAQLHQPRWLLAGRAAAKQPSNATAALVQQWQNKLTEAQQQVKHAQAYMGEAQAAAQQADICSKQVRRGPGAHKPDIGKRQALQQTSPDHTSICLPGACRNGPHHLAYNCSGVTNYCCLGLQAADQAKQMEEAGSFSAAAKASAEAAERQREASKVRPDWAPSHTRLIDLYSAINSACWHAAAPPAPQMCWPPLAAQRTNMQSLLMPCVPCPVLLHSMSHWPLDISQS